MDILGKWINNDAVICSKLEVFLTHLVSAYYFITWILAYVLFFSSLICSLMNYLPYPIQKSCSGPKWASSSCYISHQLVVILLVIIRLSPVGEKWGAIQLVRRGEHLRRRLSFEFLFWCWTGFAQALVDPSPVTSRCLAEICSPMLLKYKACHAWWSTFCSLTTKQLDMEIQPMNITGLMASVFISLEWQICVYINSRITANYFSWD